MKKRTRTKQDRNIKRPASWYVTWTILYSVGVTIVVFLILSFPIWQIQNAPEVTNNKYFSPAKIVGLAKVPVSENIFSLDLAEIRTRILTDKRIKDIKIKRKLPNNLIIVVKERVPFAVILVANDQVLIDEEGCILAKNNIASSIYKMVDIGTMPTIRGLSKKDIIKGERIDPDQIIFVKQVVKLLSRYMPLRSFQVNISSHEDISILIDDILNVKIGSTDEISKKITVLSQILKTNNEKMLQAKYIDVRLPEVPVVKFK